MATIKSYTDIEQSKKLAEILPLESADMYYFLDPTPAGNIYYLVVQQIAFGVRTREPEYDKGDIPCWSLAALLSILPQSIAKYIDNERCQKTFHLNLFRSYYHCCSYSFVPSISDDDGNNTLYCIGKDNWVDACVAMIEKLNDELKML